MVEIKTYIIDVAYCLLHSFAVVFGLDIITKLKSFMDTSGSSRWNGGTEKSLFSSQINLNGRVATGVENHSSENLLNRHADGSRFQRIGKL